MDMQQEVVHMTTEYPTGLVDAEEAAEKLKGVSKDQLLSWANGNYAPHFRINGGNPLFKMSELKRWVAKNLMTICEGAPLPKEFKIVSAGDPITVSPPAEISQVVGLMQFPRYQFASAVYFLCRDNKVVYVGQSKTPATRIAVHDSSSEKVFDRVYILPTPDYQLDYVESAFIHHLKPEYNGKNTNGVYAAPVAAAKIKHSITEIRGITP